MLRTSHKVLKCTKCGNVSINGAWMRERREYYVQYAFSVCHVCQTKTGKRYAAAEEAAPARNPAPRR